MGFIMEGLDAEDYDRRYADRDLVRRILRYFRPKLPAMAVVAAMIVATSALQSVLPVVISWGIDQLADDRSNSFLTILVALILLSGVLAWGTNYVRQALSARVTGDVVLTIREHAFAAVLKRDLSFYDENPSGKIVSRVTSDTDDFANTVTLTMNLLSQVLLVGFITALLFVRDVGLALLTLAITPIVIAIALAFRRVARDTTRRAQRSLARVNSNVQETMGGIAVAKNFRQEQTIYDEFRPINEQNYQVTLRQG
ncbi:MAG: ABC transporter ATP-binding protein, partial [Actinopolymorphaceae bacterium]